jgi:hypothetical protein
MGVRGKLRRERDKLFGPPPSTALVALEPAPAAAAAGGATSTALVVAGGALPAAGGPAAARKKKGGSRVKVQCRLGQDGEWINLKVPSAEISIEGLRPRLAGALQVPFDF